MSLTLRSEHQDFRCLIKTALTLTAGSGSESRVAALVSKGAIFGVLERDTETPFVPNEDLIIGIGWCLALVSATIKVNVCVNG